MSALLAVRQGVGGGCVVKVVLSVEQSSLSDAEGLCYTHKEVLL